MMCWHFWGVNELLGVESRKPLEIHVNVFHNEEINKNGAQLIFNTHNPIFLNANLFRRDEIKFVDREENNSSTIYSLSDFGTSGSGGVRKTDDYMKNYFVDRYGAISRADFTDLISELAGKW